MKYHKYSTEEFIADDFFQQWVLEPDQKSTTFWENWLQQHPEKQETISEAREIVLMLGSNVKRLPHERIAPLRQTLMNQLDEPSKTRNIWQWGKVAAVLAGLAATVTLVLLIARFNNTVTYSTGNGEIREIMLPDSSIITLNANSELTYEDFWSEEGMREVRIKGEAFFKISQMDTLQLPADLKRYRSFVVHTDEMDVKVLGTQFNVQTRREKTSVILNSGKVALELRNANEKEPLILMPGDEVVYDQNSQKITKRQVEAEKYSAWRFGKLFFDQTPLQEVALTIEDYYGIKVLFSDQNIAQQEFAGSVPSNNLNGLITSISRLYNLKVVKKGNTIIFQK